ncbi:Histidine kinase-, DNA gyrase B-, and HSP90-like ATPase [Tenacibaculum sp. MAR_2009_124]|uniref:sensor histidine kinase n=1 Tax=Tenacibaculum sp. MAR_2009_124 TaxID=1250059 RepID=UPI00089AEDB2|nr:HAMP domain-containing sensor histidine kinase [Tenacibaculum sp. MAR_2009_124]SEC34039.1 Histidine kinase-, DNA gyrase B-, and HSP90-like ATPase [Tenacibaculum sp. MAR_2009_124]
MTISVEFLKKVIQHIVDISNDKCSISEKDIISAYEENELKAELLSGLFFLYETITLHKKRLNEKNKVLEKNNIELEEYAHLVSHDLKSPLRGIHSLSEFIEADLEVKNYQGVTDYLILLKKRIEKMDNMINGVLKYSKISKSKAPIEKVDVAKCINEIYETFYKSDVELTITNKFPLINSEKVKIFHLFFNLIENGIKHNSKPKKTISVSYNDNVNDHIFYIKDNGLGIPKKYQKKIFSLFETLDGENKNNTGIGLSIVHKIVLGLGGTIGLESELKKGSTFIITLPKNTNSETIVL